MDEHGGEGRGGGAWRIAGTVGGVLLAALAVVALAFGGLVVLLVIALSDLEIGPGEGKESKRLPVSVTPTTALEEGSVVRVRSSAFDAGQIVGVAVCLTTADTQGRGVDACDTTSGARYAVNADRQLDATYAVPRVISVDGAPHDCADAPRTCMIVAASANDYDQSGGQVVTFAEPSAGTPRPSESGPDPTPDLPIVAWGQGPFAAATPLTVTARGFQPNEPVIVAKCGEPFVRTGDVTACDPRNGPGAVNAVMLRDVSEIRDHADSTGSFTTSVEVPASLAAVAGRGPYACTTKAGTCSVVVAAAADVRRSAILPLTIAD